jgi:hypothetical protein
VLLVPGELKKQDMKELEDAWFEEKTHSEPIPTTAHWGHTFGEVV